MKKVLLIFALLICSSEVYGISELEKAYKEKLESINKGLSISIPFEKKLYDIKSNVVSISLESCTDMQALSGVVNACEKEQRESNELINELNRITKKEDGLIEQKQDLKIKILEKFEKLPLWWTKAEDRFEKELKGWGE